ncbi:hypothetical protein ACJX0J_023786, partial [Zea mays]
ANCNFILMPVNFFLSRLNHSATAVPLMSLKNTGCLFCAQYDHEPQGFQPQGFSYILKKFCAVPLGLIWFHVSCFSGLS